MKPPDISPPPPAAAPAPPDEPPGVPGFHTWRGVYWFVAGCFVAVVALLAAFTQVFSG